MRKILENWLKHEIGIFLDFDEVHHALKDGMLFVRILKYYDAINVNSIKNVFPSEDINVCRNNLLQIKVWFKLLNIEFTNDIIKKIIQGNSSLCIYILYQLFLVFKKGDLHLVKKQKERSIVGQSTERFKVFPTNVNVETSASLTSGTSYDDCNKFLKNKEIIDWYKKKYDCTKKSSSYLKWGLCSQGDSKIRKTNFEELNINQIYSQSRSLPPKSTFSEDEAYVRDIDKKTNKHSRESLSSNSSCVDEQNNSGTNSNKTRFPFIDNSFHCGALPPISCKPAFESALPSHVLDYMKRLKSTTGFACKIKKEKPHVTRALTDVWNDIVNKEKIDIKNIFACKLVKQSCFEKDMVSRLLCILTQSKTNKHCFLKMESRLENARQSLLSATPTKAVDDLNIEQNNNVGSTHSSYFNRTKQRYIYDDYDAYCLNEKKRTVELHRKLYAEKLKLRFERHYAICLHALEDIVDLAIKRSEFVSNYGFEIPSYTWLEWKCLFFYEQPIFDVVSDVARKLFPDDPSDFDVETEKTRQDVLNECDLDMYLNLTDSWNLSNNNENENLSSLFVANQKYTIYHESQVRLGHIVHRILERKYPLPPRPRPANIPKYPIVTVVNDIEDIEALNMFRKLLSNVGILVIDVNTAVNFCLQCFKEFHNVNFTVSQESQSDDISSYSSSTNILTTGQSKTHLKNEFTQTTNSLFGENDTNCLENAANLGLTILNMMVLGVELPCTLLVDIIVEYIKCHKDDINGWVLVNFPSTLYQASELEYILTSRKFPFHLEDDIGSSSSSECRISTVGRGDMFSENSRNEKIEASSRIVPNPKTSNDEDTFKTYFSMYIATMRGVDFNQNKVSEKEIFGKNNEHSESTLLLEQPEKEGIPSLYSFYVDQGIVYDFVYETFDLDTIKQLALFILMYYFEDSKIQKFPEDLFSKEVLSEFEPNVVLNMYGSQYSFNESGMLKFTNLLSSSVVVDDDDSLSNRNSVDGPSVSYKQDLDWNIVELPIPDSAAIALANFWEVLESEYLNTLRELFFLRRNADNELVPYITFIGKQMNLYLNSEDDRQKIVSDFLEAYNSIHQNLRSDNEMINELHLRVTELKAQLIALCEEKQDRIEEIRKLLINQNWIYQEMGVYTNFCIQFLQIEVDRCLRTLNFVQDYYLTMLENYNPQPLSEVKLTKMDLYMGEKIEMNEELEDEEDIENKSTIYINPDLSKINDPLYLTIIEMLYNYSEDTDIAPLFYSVLEEKATKAYDEVLKIKSNLSGVISNEEGVVLKKFRDLNKESEMKDKKKSKSTKGTPDTLVPSVKPFDEMELLMKKLFEEWRSVVSNEIDRFSFRVDLIKKIFREELKKIEKSITSKFTEFSSKEKEIILRELSCIDDICYLFQLAIEERTPINAQIIFEKDTFFTILNPENVVPPQIKLPIALEELLMEETFTVNQLEELKVQLQLIAPKGHITQEALINYIQGIIAYIYTRESAKLVPRIWTKLQKQDLCTLFQRLFGHYSIVEWRDFLIYCLDLPFPLTEDIIDARLQFLRYDLLETECVTYEDYMQTTLWFERELPESPLHALRNVLSKEFIFSLFKRNNRIINYMAMLLSFCRDEDPKIGFGKALSLYLGRCVIVYEEDLYLEKILTDQIETEVKVVTDILNEILDDIINNAMSRERQTISNITNMENFLRYQKLGSFVDSSNSENVVLTKSMYHEIFRRHSVFQWTSKVPSGIVVPLLSVSFYTMLLPDHIYLQPNVFQAIKDYLSPFGEGDVYVPELVNCWWLEVNFARVRKFCAYSVTSIIKEILKERSQ